MHKINKMRFCKNKISPEIIINVKSALKSNKKNIDIAIFFGISRSAVSRISLGHYDYKLTQ